MPSKKFVKAYGHNGYFKSLEETVHFYNTRDLPAPGGRRRKSPSTSTPPSSGISGSTTERNSPSWRS